MSQHIKDLSLILLRICHILVRVDLVNLKTHLYHSLQYLIALLNPFMMHGYMCYIQVTRF